MLPQQQQHVFSHQHYPGPDWQQQQQQQQQHHSHHHHAQAAAAAAAAAQQQHYGRIAAGSTTGIHENGGNDGRQSLPMNGQGEGNTNDENRRVLEWIAQMMRPETRESALLELSKKREQVPELALILWHSFGKRSKGHQERDHFADYRKAL